MLESASVVGLNFPVDPVEEIVPAALVPVRPHIDRIESRGLVREADDAGEGVYRFHHILVRDSAYNRLPKRIRATLHARFARWGERVNRERGRELEFQEIMGFHLEQARRYLLELAPLDEEGRELGRRAAGHLAPAGRRAFGRGDMAAAANLLGRSVDLLPEDAPERIELLPELGEALMEIGEFADAQALLDEAVAAAASLGDPTLEADAILTRLLVAHHTLDDLEGWRSEVQQEAERLIPLLEHEDAAAVRAKAWRMVAFVHGRRLPLAGDGGRARARDRRGAARRRPEDDRAALGLLRDGAHRRADSGAGRDRAGRGGARLRPRRPAGRGCGAADDGAAARDVAATSSGRGSWRRGQTSCCASSAPP